MHERTGKHALDKHREAEVESLFERMARVAREHKEKAQKVDVG
jgi:hypothetical protein